MAEYRIWFHTAAGESLALRMTGGYNVVCAFGERIAGLLGLTYYWVEGPL